MIVSIWKNLLCLSTGKKNRFHLSRFPWDIRSILETCYFEYFENRRLHTPKVTLSICRIFWHLFVGKRLISFPTFFGVIAKMQTSYFGYFGYAWLSIPKMIVSTCRNFHFYLHAKIDFIICFFLQILRFKEYCNLIDQQYFCP